MAKAAANKGVKKSRRRVTIPGWRPRFLGALVVGVLLLVLGAVLWQQFASNTFNDRLIRKLPKDSVTAGVGRLSALDSVKLKQYSQGTNVYAGNTQQILNALNRSGLTQEQLSEAVDDQFAWATTNRGSVAVFTVANETALRDAAAKLGAQMDNRQAAELDGLKADTGTLRGTTIPVITAVSGRELYIASNAELIKLASKEQNGFTSIPEFSEVSADLPPASGGYVFFNTPAAKSKLGFGPSLVGVAWSPARDHIDLTVRTPDTGPVQNGLPNTNGKLLPGTDQAIASVEGTEISKYLKLLEEQRQETDLPRVLSLQNGLANLSRTLGADVTQHYLDAATGKFTYGRFVNAQGQPEWLAMVEFPSGETAQSTVTELMNQLTQKVTVPVRREVVTVLPDNSQSREIVSEGRVPLAFADYVVAGRSGKAAALPSIGTVYLLTEGKYLLVSSEPDGIQRALSSLGQRHDGVSAGPLTVRINVAEAYQLLGERDVLFDWIVATRPSGGRFTLKPNGELSGTLEFNEVR